MLLNKYNKKKTEIATTKFIKQTYIRHIELDYFDMCYRYHSHIKCLSKLKELKRERAKKKKKTKQSNFDMVRKELCINFDGVFSWKEKGKKITIKGKNANNNENYNKKKRVENVGIKRKTKLAL